MDKKPFDGINVVEFCWAGVGAYSLNFLAYYGATVVRVESHTYPDMARSGPPYRDGIPGMERNAVFPYTHPVKKYSISLNLKQENGKELARKLVSWADVVVESFTWAKTCLSMGGRTEGVFRQDGGPGAAHRRAEHLKVITSGSPVRFTAARQRRR